MPDWFAQHAPKPTETGGDWFAANSPQQEKSPEQPGFIERTFADNPALPMEGRAVAGLVRLAARHPVGAAATVGGLAAVPLTGGASIPAGMAAAGLGGAGGAGLAIAARQLVNQRPEPAQNTLTSMAVNGALESLGYGVGAAAPMAVRGGLRLARNASGTALDVASHVPGLRTPARVARFMLRMLPEAAEAAPATANTGGRLVPRGTQPSVEDAMAEALREVRTAQPKPTAVSLPPPRELPAGYQPRTSAPVIKVKPKETPPAATSAPAPRVVEPATTPDVAATGRKFGDTLSQSEQAALKRELSARGGTPEISADDAARYLREYGQMIPPGTRQSRQGRYINNALEDQRYRFHLDNPASALALTAAGAAAFRQAILSALGSTTEQQP